MATPLDLTALDSEVLDAMRIAILTEQERRARAEQLPAQLADMTRAAVAAGITEAAVRDAVDAGLTPAAPPAPTEDVTE